MEFSKSAGNAQKRIDSQIGESFKEYKARKEREQQERLNEQTNLMENQASLIYAANARKREKEAAMEKELNYDNKVLTLGLTEALTEVVKDSLLLDLDEYAKLNENYEGFIRETIKSFLEKGEINTNIENKNTLSILEFINTHKPEQSVGVYLNESELLEQITGTADKDKEDLDARDEFGRPSWNECGEDIELMSGNVMDRVAELVDKDRESAQEVDDQLNAMVTPIAMGESAEVMPLIKNTHTKKTVLEVLAINEAKEMLAEKKEYNSDLALANAVTYLTILETLDESGLVKIGKEGYRAILEAAGETTTRRVAKDSHSINLIEKKDEEEIKEKAVLFESNVSEARHAGFKSFSQWKQERSNFAHTATTTLTEDNKQYDYIDKNGNKLLLEDVRKELIHKGIDLETCDFRQISTQMGYKRIR